MNYPEQMPEIPEVSKLEQAWGTVAHLPALADIPAEFDSHRGNNPATAFVSTAFFNGWAAALAKYNLHPRYPMTQAQGDAVILLLSAHMKSWEPQHEHKEAGCGMLLDRWFVVKAKA